MLDPIPATDIVANISDVADLISGIHFASTRVGTTMETVQEYLSLLAASDNPTLPGRAASFISMNSSRIRIEFSTIGRRLRRRVLEAATRERHGDYGLRIVRLLLDSGKLDEKQVRSFLQTMFKLIDHFQISKVTMMAAKDVRPLLLALSTDSMVSIQEVPKSADRNPSRTFYLWYVPSVSGDLAHLV